MHPEKFLRIGPGAVYTQRQLVTELIIHLRINDYDRTNIRCWTLIARVPAWMEINERKLNACVHGRPHIGANGVSWLQLEKWMKIKKREHAKRAVFYVYVIFWEQSGQAGVENGAMLTTYLFRYILQNAPFRSQIFFASGGKGALTPLTKILRTFLSVLLWVGVIPRLGWWVSTLRPGVHPTCVRTWTASCQNPSQNDHSAFSTAALSPFL